MIVTPRNGALLVTGGAGFIGSNFIRHMMDANKRLRIICLDKLTYAADISNLDFAMNAENFRFVHGDICDAALVDRVFTEEHPSQTINFAAETHVDNSITDPGPFMRTNIIGAQVLLDACRTHGCDRFHQVSTDEVYGELPIDPSELKFIETDPVRPSSPYSASKASQDLLALAYRRTYALPVTVSRCSNNYGPNQHAEKLIPLMVSRALSDKELPVYGDGLNVRDWLHVSDHCRALELILKLGRPGEIYNVGAGDERANIDVVRQILRLLGKPDSLIRFVPDRPGHDARYAVDSSKLVSELGWRKCVNFDEGLRQTVMHYAKKH